eukprot:SAG22_NODE_1222_length_5126_cov_3.213248_4_plen_225_part_00
MDPLLEIGDDDYIVGGGTITDVYSVLKHEGIKHLIYMGYAENICMQYKAEGMFNMVRQRSPLFTALPCVSLPFLCDSTALTAGRCNQWKLGFDFILARDATDAFTGYDQNRPWLNPDNGTALITNFVEQHAAKTTEIREFAQAMGTWEAGTQQVFLAPVSECCSCAPSLLAIEGDLQRAYSCCSGTCLSVGERRPATPRGRQRDGGSACEHAVQHDDQLRRDAP